MITDSIDAPRGLILPPAIGALAGIGASFLGLVGLRLAQTSPFFQTSHSNDVVLSPGGIFYFLSAAMLGILYAACQRQAPIRALFVVGIFYSFVMSILGRLFTKTCFPSLAENMHQAGWWIVPLLYGAGLACISACCTKWKLLLGNSTELKD